MVDWDEWLYGTGMPPVQNKFDTTLVEASRSLAKRFVLCACVCCVWPPWVGCFHPFIQWVVYECPLFQPLYSVNCARLSLSVPSQDALHVNTQPYAPVARRWREASDSDLSQFKPEDVKDFDPNQYSIFLADLKSAMPISHAVRVCPGSFARVPMHFCKLYLPGQASPCVVRRL